MQLPQVKTLGVKVVAVVAEVVLPILLALYHVQVDRVVLVAVVLNVMVAVVQEHQVKAMLAHRDVLVQMAVMAAEAVVQVLLDHGV